MEEVYISVIITAYNRKKFLLKAITSAVNQTLSKDKYEIIIIKNFYDESIDKIISEHKIKNINMDGNIGKYLYTGLNEAKGNIISFLDDDDMFFENKLEVVYEMFKNNKKLVYFHNLPQFIDENDNSVGGTGNAASFNMSCISIKKEIVNSSNLAHLLTLQDSFMLYSAFDNGGLVISGNQILSYYRLHNSTSHIDGAIDSKIDFKNNLFQDFISQLEIFYMNFKSRKSKKYILNYMITMKLNVNIYTKLGHSNKYYKIKYNEIIKYLFIFNYWGKRRRYPLKFFKLLEVHLPRHILSKMILS